MSYLLQLLATCAAFAVVFLGALVVSHVLALREAQR